MVIGRRRRREHHQPTLCTTTKKKGREKVREKNGKKYGGDIRENSTGKKEYGGKVRGKSKGESADVVEITPTNMLYYY